MSDIEPSNEAFSLGEARAAVLQLLAEHEDQPGADLLGLVAAVLLRSRCCAPGPCRCPDAPDGALAQVIDLKRVPRQ